MPEGAGDRELSAALADQARKAAAARGITIGFVIATLPDYVDSNSGWGFDPQLDALQRGAAAAGYVLDQFYLPDWHPANHANPTSGLRHEIEPGVVFFRRSGPDSPRRPEDPDILGVFTVTETPTAGLHETPFLVAAHFIEDWNSQQGYTLRVLGPAFSGSAPSLRRVVDAFLKGSSHPPVEVRIISGSATSPRNKTLLEFKEKNAKGATPSGAADGTPVTFGATVRSDDVMLCRLQEHLETINPQWRAGAHVALLVESNTAYGQSIQTASGEAGCEHPFAHALRIPFPLHISRLRAEAERAQATQTGPPRRQATLDVQDRDDATDVLPSMSPQWTAASVDTMVAQILATIRREQYTAVGILSTDKRDHLFLAERLVQEVPNALLFTTEADLIYTHPSYRAFVRGAIIASTYPLFNAAQTLTTPYLASSGRQQFPTMAAEGVYNAFLKLLDHDEAMLDYPPPGCISANGRLQVAGAQADPCLVPPVWISVVGQDGIWPIDSHPHASSGVLHDDDARSSRSRDRYTVALNPAPVANNGRGDVAAPAGEHPLLNISWWGLALALIILGALVVNTVAYLAAFIPQAGESEHGVRRRPLRLLEGLAGRWGRQRTRCEGIRLLRAGPERDAALQREHRQFLAIAAATLSFPAIWVLRLVAIRFGWDVASGAEQTSVWLVVYLVPLLFVAFESVVAVRARRAASPDGWVPGAVVTLVSVGLAAATVYYLARFIGSETWSDETDSRLLFARAVNPGDWVSPAVPMLTLTGIAYLWTVWNIRHLMMGGSSYHARSALLDIMTGREPRLGREAAATVASAWRFQSWSSMAIPIGVFVTFWIYVPQWYTPDGAMFDRFLWWASLLVVFLVAHSLSQTVHLWTLLRQIFRHLDSHPMRDAFVAVGRQPIDWSLSLTPPRLIELKPMARLSRTLGLDLSRLVSAARVASPVRLPAAERRQLRGQPKAHTVDGDPRDRVTARALRVRHLEADGLTHSLADIMAEDVDTEVAHAAGRTPYFESDYWKRLTALSEHLIPALCQGFWQRGSRTGTEAVDAWYRQAEVLVGMQLAFVLRGMLSRLVSGMSVTIVGALLALCGHLFYSFPGRSAMLAFDWIVLALAVTAATLMLMSLERETVLSHLWSTAPGRISWTGGFVYRLGLYGLVPLLTLFVWQFPELSGNLFGWLEPLQRAMP